MKKKTLIILTLAIIIAIFLTYYTYITTYHTRNIQTKTLI